MARCEVLDRLLAMNHKQYEEEVRQALHEKKGKQGKRKKTSGGKKEDDKHLALF